MKILREQVVTVKKGKLMMVFRFYYDKGKAFEVIFNHSAYLLTKTKVVPKSCHLQTLGF